MTNTLEKKGGRVKKPPKNTAFGDIIFQNFMRMWKEWDPELDSTKLAKASGISKGYIDLLKGGHRYLGPKAIPKLTKVFGCDRLDFIQISDINHIMQDSNYIYFKELKKLKEILENDQLETSIKEMVTGCINNAYQILQKSRFKKKQNAS